MLNLKSLPNSSPDEKIVYLLRRHPLTLFWLGFCYLASLLLPFIIWWYLSAYQSWLLKDPTWSAILTLIGSFLFLYVWLFLFQNFMDYHLDIWVVTTNRILNIEQTGLFGRSVSELRLYRIQDVTAGVHGMLHTLFDYGNVEIQTAGEMTRFQFEDVPHPNTITKTILELAEVDRRKHLDEAVEEFETPSSKKI